ncbi:MHYT domain-containing protein [Streptomyces sp. NPDC056909]|uniref:MHYT domain-containing protein n=1 Tax=Streptomyces sp. NPDC056909 TaxID=3345963 RepID=UPI0036C867BB
MQGTVEGFSYGLVTPVAAFLMACLGAALGLRCTARSLRARRPWKPGGLALGAASIGSGVWTMHFIGMMGFAVTEVPVGYDRLTTFASLAVGIVMTGIGIFIVGYRGSTPMALVTGGTVTGLGIATMHYLGMAGVRLHGQVAYDTGTVALSVLIAVAASVAGLWVTATHHGFSASLAASLVLGVASTGMHFTAMAGVEVHLDGTTAAPGGAPATELLVPMLIGPAVFLLLAGVALVFDPLLVTGGRDADRDRDRDRGDRDPDRGRRWGRLRSGRTSRTARPPGSVRGLCGSRGLGGVPSQRTRPRADRDSREAADRTAARAPRSGPQDLHDW